MGIPQTKNLTPSGQEYIRTLLEKQVEFNEIKTITDPKVDLLIGAVDALSGDFCVFKNLLPPGYETKLDRSPEFIKKVMNHGYNQADDFLKEVPAYNEQLRNIVY